MKKIFSTLVLSFCLTLTGCTGWVYKVPTGSMMPTINPGDMVMVNKYAYSSGEIERFDIVIFNAPDEVIARYNMEEDTKYVMRVIGMPNETLEIKDNKIYINGRLLDESFEKNVSHDDFKKNFAEINIPAGEYFILGDNRPQSDDARYWQQKTVKRSDIVGKVVEIIPKEY
jgi:signal peptidase I